MQMCGLRAGCQHEFHLAIYRCCIQHPKESFSCLVMQKQAA